jgi:hypothetical protein
MNKELIRDLAITGGIYDCICDPYDKLKNGDPYSSVMPDLERFAKKIILECCELIDNKVMITAAQTYDEVFVAKFDTKELCAKQIKEHFGVQE